MEKGTAKIELHYFGGVRARAECIRLLLHAAGQPFKDVTITREEWGEVKKSTPYGQVPYVIYNGKKYGQSMAIATFFARKFGFYGKTDEDGLRIDEAVQLFHDLRVVMREWFWASDPAKKAELQAKLTTEAFPRYFTYFERMLAENGSTGYFVGNSVSLADLVIYECLETAQGMNPDCLQAFPALSKLRSNVQKLPKLKDYLASRPKLPW